MLGGDSETPPSLCRNTLHECEAQKSSKASDCETRLSPARACAQTLNRRRIGAQHGRGETMGPRIFDVLILREDEEVTNVVGPVTQGMKIERAPHRGGFRLRLDPRERVSVSHAPPSIHVDLRLPPQSEGWRPYTGIVRRAMRDRANNPCPASVVDGTLNPHLRTEVWGEANNDSRANRCDEHTRLRHAGRRRGTHRYIGRIPNVGAESKSGPSHASPKPRSICRGSRG